MVYVFALRVLLRLVFWRKVSKISLPDTASLVLAILGVICMAYGYFVEPYRFSVTRVEIRSSKLPSSATPIRIVQLSDFHSDPQPRLETRIPDAVAAEHPDLIVFTGDAINEPAGLSVFQGSLSRLA